MVDHFSVNNSTTVLVKYVKVFTYKGVYTFYILLNELNYCFQIPSPFYYYLYLSAVNCELKYFPKNASLSHNKFVMFYSLKTCPTTA